jgi:hypothetical protein
LNRWGFKAVPKREFHSTKRIYSGTGAVMEKRDETRRMSWPWWATWALLAVIVTSAATIAATLYDIL